MRRVIARLLIGVGLAALGIVGLVWWAPATVAQYAYTAGALSGPSRSYPVPAYAKWKHLSATTAFTQITTTAGILSRARDQHRGRGELHDQAL